jgi:UDP-N-acetylmuramyl pentapeptide phosphotransferase/UDP-N-acetylglucosamine-1-phosphate transferase
MNLLEAALVFISMSGLTSAGVAFVASFLLCIAVVLTKRWHGAFSMDTSDGIQKFHYNPTSRIGGIPIVLALAMAWGNSNAAIKDILEPILFAGMPAFLYGIAEDLTKQIGVVQRLLATMASGILAWWITDYSLSRLDIWGADTLMQFTFFSVIFTAFAVGGVANSINIIDGFNGYASLTCSIGFIGFALIAFQVGDKNLAVVSAILAASVLGFFWVNWPFGKLFLGDGGAYFLGFSLAWIAVLLIERNQSVSAFAALVICILPITEVLISIFRRKVRNMHPGKPDNLHFHSIFFRRYVSKWFVKWTKLAKNSLSGFIMGLMSLASTVLANLIYDNTLYCIITSLLFALGYVAVFARMVRHHWCSPISFLFFKPALVNSSLPAVTK